MKIRSLFVAFVALNATLLASAFGGYGGDHAPAWHGKGRHHATTTVFTMSNSPAGNELIALSLNRWGSLSESGRLATGGNGTGGGLGNQSGLVLSDDAQWLIAVNAGSNTVSVFAFNDGEPELTDVADSLGDRPVSVAIRKDLVYVLNAGSDSVAGFFINSKGKLIALANSEQPLSASGVGAAQVGISPDLNYLYVTEKATDTITTFVLDDYGVPTEAVFTPSNGMTPFGFTQTRGGALIVTEAFGGGPAEARVSSYQVLEDGGLETISSSVGTTQVAACWVALSRDGRYAYTTNTPSQSISSFRVSQDGQLELLDGVAGTPGMGPVDLSMSIDGRFLFTLNSGDESISVFRALPNGLLIPLGTADGLPDGANGLVAY